MVLYINRCHLVGAFFMCWPSLQSRDAQGGKDDGKQEAEARKEYERAKTRHYEQQAPKTKKMMKEDRKRARELNRHLERG